MKRSSADHERDWPPCKVFFFGLATNALNVRNNNNNNKYTVGSIELQFNFNFYTITATHVCTVSTHP